ncbi:phage integrase central domain-containing protein [Acidocella sp.]|uniref:tyrosine-type recombinase/integrase n=1 Tax=Acidocella sp. TaxID=50710 RepID=UPI00260D15F4|nr:integrase arm-type DNA-binding domain-containing protein [Acidocella sp.]
MARQEKRLSALAVTKAAKPGMYADGLGLYLRIGPSGAKSWVFRYRVGNGRRDMGLGPLHIVSLADARAKAAECRKQRLDRADPLQVREAAILAAKLEEAKAKTFQDCADAYITAHAPGWRNAKHADQWRNTLLSYAYPVFGAFPIQTVDTALVMKVLEPIWATKTETASRLRGRIECILDWATVREYRRGENPARWRGHLENLLPKRQKVQKVEHHTALPYAEMSSFMTLLRAQEGIAARAFEFLILTATRTSETIGATWDEIDLDAKIWTIPASRIKAGREHRVPLSPAAILVLEGMKFEGSDHHVFPGGRPGACLSNMAMLKLLERMGKSHLTVHGFRSTFRDWVSERTNFPREVAEMALAHAISDKVEAAYRRGDLFEKRQKLMETWAAYCETVPSHSEKRVATQRSH